MLRGVERKVIRGVEVRRELREDDGLEKVEIKRAIGSLKDGKAIGTIGTGYQVKYRSTGGKDW